MKKKILIIEDEPDVADTIKMYLEQAGYLADFTLDAQEGLRMLPKYDLLLLDLIMPKVSGRAVLKEMKAKKISKPVVVLSAVTMPMVVSAELSKEYPDMVFVPKTAMYSDLIPAIKKALGG
ncbi:MAG: response regulator [Candidatus Micrarchaeota archaeon]